MLPFILRENMVKLLYAIVGSQHLSPMIERLKTILDRNILMGIFSELGIEYVVDVGANEGQYAATLRRLGYRGMIFSFEPNRDVFYLMEKRFAKDSKWRGFNYAIGSSEGELHLNVYEESSISSFLRGNEKIQNASRINRVEKVPVRRLDAVLPSLIPELGRKRIFLKSDTQGFDVEVVRGAEGIMKSIYGLQSEISVQPIYHEMPKYLESLSYYEGLGFVLMDLWLVTRTTRGEVMEYDCVMKRTE
jgi:FkbM family methyltransferase